MNSFSCGVYKWRWRCVQLGIVISCLTGNAFALGPPLTTLTMDDMPQQSVDGLSHPSGVIFGYSINGAPSDLTRYNANGPGTITFIDDPSIEGPTEGVLRLDFAHLTSVLEFGVALSAPGPVNDAIEVTLFGPNGQEIVSSTTLDLTVLEQFAEAQFLHSGAAVKSAEIDFTPSVGRAARFAFDNLTFVPVPEPATVSLALVAAGWLLTRCREAH